MMFNSEMLTHKLLREYIKDLVANNQRVDGRGFDEMRPIEVLNGTFTKAEGEAWIKLGKTQVLVGVKADIGEPFPDTPDKGVLVSNTELLPVASPTFEPGPPNENSIELARVVDRGIRESKAIGLEDLCIIPGKKVFIVFVDIYVLNHDGNLIDASALAALAALTNTKMFNYEVKNGEIEIKPGYKRLPIKNYPIAVTFAKINDKLIVDPWLEEENVMDARLTITFEKEGKICALQKGGSGHFTPKQILEAVKIASEKSEELRKLVVKK